MGARKLRLGVIGAGSWAEASHLPRLASRRDEVDFVSVCRRGAEPLGRVAERWEFGHATEDYRETLAQELDICVVASPAGMHHEQARAAIDSGAHVLVEKPFTLSSADAWDLVDAADRAGRHLLVAFGWNYRPMVRAARDLLVSKPIGDIEHLSVHMASVTRELLSNRGAYTGSDDSTAPEQATWTDPAMSGGGYAQAQLAHALGLALWLTGLRADSVFALMSAPLDAPVELHDAISVRFDNGAIGTVAGGSCHSGSDGDKHQLEIRAIGSDGQFHIDLERELVWLYRGRDDDTRLGVGPGDGTYDCFGPPDALVDLALGRHADNCSPGELAARTVEFLDAAYESSVTRQLVAVRRPPAPLRAG